MLGCINAREVRCNQRQEGKGNQQRKHEVLQGVACRGLPALNLPLEPPCPLGPLPYLLLGDPEKRLMGDRWEGKSLGMPFISLLPTLKRFHS